MGNHLPSLSDGDGRNGDRNGRNGRNGGNPRDGQVLITGGAGFIGSHLARELLSHGYRVRVLDILSPQVHGKNAARPDYLEADAELLVGDVRDEKAVREAL